jgi:hypothetical protein
LSHGKYGTIKVLKPVGVPEEEKQVLRQEFVDVKLEMPSTKRQSTIKAARIVPPPRTNSEYSDDSEDEFFDAIDSNNLPNLIIPPPLSSPLQSPAHLPPYISTLPYSSYAFIREKLDTADTRPPTSLWSVLKHSIGKDLTRISFPVFFNEPTSMLQRMAEDMEFSECCEWFFLKALVFIHYNVLQWIRRRRSEIR